MTGEIFITHKENSENKRSYPRFNVEYEVRYKNLMCDIPQKYRQFVYAKSINISRRGMCISTPAPIERGTMLHSEVNIYGRIIKSYCDVCWSKPSERGNSFECGMRFVVFNDGDTDYIEETAEKYGKMS